MLAWWVETKVNQLHLKLGKDTQTIALHFNERALFVLLLQVIESHCKFLSSGKIIYICDDMMEVTEEGKIYFVAVCCHHDYHRDRQIDKQTGKFL